MTPIGRCGAILMLGGLSGCVIAPLPQGPLPLVAVPGPTKTAAEFQQDDVACREAAAAPAQAHSAPTVPGKLDQAAGPPPAQPDQSQDGAMAAGGIYLHCMESRNNVVQPLAPVRPLVYAAAGGYGYYPSYGPYDGYSTYPWLYDGYPGIGYYGGYFGVGYGGWRGGYGGGFHGGWGGGRR